MKILQFFLGISLVFTAILLRYLMYKAKYKRLEDNVNRAEAYRDSLKKIIEVDGKRIKLIEELIEKIKSGNYELTEERV